MNAYACVRCATPITGDDPWWCPNCEDDTLAVQVAEPEPITTPQRIRMCVLFRNLGEVHRATRMRTLTRLTGRYIADYNDLTSREATTIVIPALERETRGVR